MGWHYFTHINILIEECDNLFMLQLHIKQSSYRMPHTVKLNPLVSSFFNLFYFFV
ncbi:Uncharacterised protein [Achromobacter xylosoxidans]|nr:Uncharacterised protein [Achromobacter xylosoxidans]